MTWLIDAALDRSRTVLLILALLLIGGIVSFMTIPRESAPDIPIPTIYVSVTHTGISPEDAERLLVRPLEQELRSIEGLDEIRATAEEGLAWMLLEFDTDIDIEQALSDVRERVDDAKIEFPDDTDEPTIDEVNIGLFPVLIVTLSGELPERALLRAARALRDEIEAVPNVLEAQIAGDRDELGEIIIDPLLLESYRINERDFLTLVDRSNRLVAAGALDTGAGRFPIKVPGLFQSVDDILNLPVSVKDGAVVTLRDITQARRSFVDPLGFPRLNGQPAVAIEVSKRLGENIIDAIANVKAVVEAMRPRLPGSLQITYVQDESQEIRTMLRELQNNVINAILLVMIVIVAALGLRTAALVGLAIPTSFLIGILVLSSFGLTMNIVVLFSLILAVGILVDGAIVVTEYADRKMIEGVVRKEAYALAAKRMAWPITASTATTLAAFMPLLFWPGTVGEFMKFLPITLIAVLSGSLLTALVFVPTLGAFIGKAGSGDAATARAVAQAGGSDVAAMPGLTGGYVRLLAGALHHPGKVLIAALAILVGVYAYYASHGNGVEFFPDVEPEKAQVQVHARGNLSVWEKNALVAQVEQRIQGIEGIESVYARAGGERLRQELAEDVIGINQLEFTDWQTRPAATEIFAEIRRRTAELAGILVETRAPDAGPPIGKPVQIVLSAHDPARLEPALVLILEAMRQIDGFIDIEDSRPMPGIEWEVAVDRAQASIFGADLAQIGTAIQLVTNGIKVGEYRPDDADEEIEIRARYPQDDRSIDQLDRIRVQTAQGIVPIANFIERTARPRVGQITRTDGLRTLTIKADVAPGLLADDLVTELRDRLAEAAVFEGVGVRFKGEDEKQAEASAFLSKALVVALFVMAIILVTQFNSFYSAFLILSAVVLSTVGVILGLIITGQAFGIVMGGIGVIALAGIVVNNNIVLIDTYDRLARSGLAVREAILRTGAQRLRPVLLTTVTTILGLMPMVLGVNIDFVSRAVTIGAPSTQWWNQLATAVVCGLAFATVLTLVVTPCLLMLRADLRGLWHRPEAGSGQASAPPRRAVAAGGAPEN